MKIRSILLGMTLGVVLVSCKPSDADVEKAISEKLNDPDIQVTVHEGVATITGVCDDEIFKKNIEKSCKGYQRR